MNTNEHYSSKKIKRNKESKFTEIRNPYKKYQKAKWNWSDIFLEIDLLKYEETKIFKIISNKYNINIKTLRNKYYDYKKNIINDVDVEHRGILNKSFTEKEEKEIFLFLKINFIDKNKVLCNDIIKIHALEKFKNLYPNDKFNASNGWCDMFKQRWNLSTVKISISKLASTTYTEKEINIFLDSCKKAVTKVGVNFFSI